MATILPTTNSSVTAAGPQDDRAANACHDTAKNGGQKDIFCKQFRNMDQIQKRRKRNDGDNGIDHEFASEQLEAYKQERNIYFDPSH